MSTNVPITVAYGDGIGLKPHALKARREVVHPEMKMGLDGIDVAAASPRATAATSKKTETLRTYNGTAGHTLSQGQ
jgi:hypothetical protein